MSYSYNFFKGSLTPDSCFLDVVCVKNNRNQANIESKPLYLQKNESFVK